VRDLTPIIFVTAHDDPETRSQALASGCAGYFKKTDSAEVILEAIRRAVGMNEGCGGNQ
jgi:DNA-binding NarL/FixJ family response regulator